MPWVGVIATPTGGSTSTFYYDGEGQLLQTNVSGTLAEQQVWGVAYINALIFSNGVASGGGNYGLASSGLDERLYADQDANWDTTSLYQVNGSPGVAQRIIYDPYGTPTLLSSAWASYSGASLNFRILYQGEYQVPEANVYIMGTRVYDYTLGAWDQKDAAGYAEGDNLYQAEVSNPVGSSRYERYGQHAASGYTASGYTASGYTASKYAASKHTASE